MGGGGIKSAWGRMGAFEDAWRGAREGGRGGVEGCNGRHAGPIHPKRKWGAHQGGPCPASLPPTQPTSLPTTNQSTTQTVIGSGVPREVGCPPFLAQPPFLPNNQPTDRPRRP
jgi:hypothetical protein